MYYFITNGTMPNNDNKLTEAELKLIFDWIKQGAKNN
jgi:hypothetical protein